MRTALFTAIVGMVALALAGCLSSDDRPAAAPRPNPPPPPAANPEPAPPPTAPARTVPVHEQIGKACESLAAQLADKLPAGKAVAVLPLADSDGGIRRLGVLAAEEIRRLLLDRGVKLVARESLEAVLRERAIQMAAAASDPDMRQRIGGLAKADILVVGSLAEAGREVLISQEAVAVDTGRSIAMTKKEPLAAGEMGQLMWYVRRPTAAQGSGTLPPLALRYEFMTPQAGGEAALADGSTVTSLQKFKIRVQPNSDCHLYVLLYDSRGRASLLFPHEKIALGNEVRGGASYEIPEASKWYWFDEDPGLETFYLVASYTPLPDLDQLLAKMQDAGAQQAQLAAAAREKIDTVITRGMSPETSSGYQVKGYTVQKRGVGGVVDIGMNPATVDTAKIDNLVEGHATAVKKIVLRHR